jgi:putative photosynthetic complex assembly protein
MRPLPDFGFPRLPLIVAAAMVGLSLTGAAAGRLGAWAAPAPTETAVAARDLVFEDRADGAVVARDAGTLRTVEVFEGENGFLRGTLRGLARTRKSEQVGRAAPFRLSHWADGRLTLDDPSTGRHVELLAFGATNAAVFAHLLALPEHAL